MFPTVRHAFKALIIRWTREEPGVVGNFLPEVEYELLTLHKSTISCVSYRQTFRTMELETPTKEPTVLTANASARAERPEACLSCSISASFAKIRSHRSG